MVVKMGLVCNIVFMSKSQGWVSIIQMICVFDLTYEMLSHIDWSNANSSRILIDHHSRGYVLATITFSLQSTG